MVYGLWSMITPAHLPHVTDRDPVLNPSPQGGTLTAGRGIACGVGQPIAVRVPRLRGTQKDH
jgi:hypothetical protein